MTVKCLTKRCERCERKFEIPNLREGTRVRIIAIQYTPCPYCYYVPDISNPRFNKSGRCISCSLPFSMVDHKAKGKCHRCLMDDYRNNSTK